MFAMGDLVETAGGYTGLVGREWTDTHYSIHVDYDNPRGVEWHHVDALTLIRATKYREV